MVFIYFEKFITEFYKTGNVKSIGFLEWTTSMICGVEAQVLIFYMIALSVSGMLHNTSTP